MRFTMTVGKTLGTSATYLAAQLAAGCKATCIVKRQTNRGRYGVERQK